MQPRIACGTKMLLNFLRNSFASSKANLVSETMFPELSKQGNIDRMLWFNAIILPSFKSSMPTYTLSPLSGNNPTYRTIPLLKFPRCRITITVIPMSICCGVLGAKVVLFPGLNLRSVGGLVELGDVGEKSTRWPARPKSHLWVEVV